MDTMKFPETGGELKFNKNGMMSSVSEFVFESDLAEVFNSMKKQNYDPINQFVAYLISDDPSYITSFEGARSKVTAYKRNEILQCLVRKYWHCALRDIENAKKGN